VIRVQIPGTTPPISPTLRGTIVSAQPGWWYENRVGQIITIEREDYEGYWAREGGVYNCINKLVKTDVELIPNDYEVGESVNVNLSDIGTSVLAEATVLEKLDELHYCASVEVYRGTKKAFLKVTAHVDAMAKSADRTKFC
jgi:hypothetical protein